MPDPGYESRARSKHKFRDSQTRRVRGRGAQIDSHARLATNGRGFNFDFVNSAFGPMGKGAL